MACAGLLLISLPAPAQRIVRSWEIRGAPRGTWVHGCAYDPIVDVLWVVDPQGGMLERYARDGSRVNGFRVPEIGALRRGKPSPVGITVDPATGNAWVVEWDQVVYEVTPSGSWTGRGWDIQATTLSPSAIALEPGTGTLFVCDDKAKQIVAFDAAGRVRGKLSIAHLAGSSSVIGLAYDSTTGSLLATLDLAKTVIEFDPLGRQRGSQGLHAVFPNDLPLGLALDTRTGSAFVGGFRVVHEVLGVVAPCSARRIRYGGSCRDPRGGLPRLRATACATVGAVIGLGTVSSAELDGTAIYVFGGPRTSISLAAFGAPACTLNTLPSIVVSGVPMRHGRSLVGVRIPSDVGLRGATFRVHALIATPRSLHAPNALELQVQ